MSDGKKLGRGQVRRGYLRHAFGSRRAILDGYGFVFSPGGGWRQLACETLASRFVALPGSVDRTVGLAWVRGQ